MVNITFEILDKGVTAHQALPIDGQIFPNKLYFGLL